MSTPKKKQARQEVPAENKVPRDERGRVYSGTPGNKGGTGRPDLAVRARNAHIAELIRDEIHKRLIQQPESIEFAELTTGAKTFCADLRVNKSEVSVRDPLTIVLKRE